MGVKELIAGFGAKGKQRRELLNRMEEQSRMERIVQERQLSSNERELNQLENETREEMIKERLEVLRKERQDDISFGHQPLDTENIITKTQWEVLKEPSVFNKKSNMLSDEASVMRNDSSLLRSNKNLLKNNNKLLKGGSMFKI